VQPTLAISAVSRPSVAIRQSFWTCVPRTLYVGWFFAMTMSLAG